MTAFSQNGQEISRHLILTGDFSIHSGYEMTYELLKRGTNIDAIFAACDLVAIGVIKALKSKRKKIPEDIEIIGFDRIELSEIFEPSLSTIVQSIYEIAIEVSKMLVNIIEGSIGSIRHIIVEPILSLRETTRVNII